MDRFLHISDFYHEKVNGLNILNLLFFIYSFLLELAKEKVYWSLLHKLWIEDDEIFGLSLMT